MPHGPEPSLTAREAYDTVAGLQNTDAADAAGGGVAVAVVAERAGVSRDTARRALNALAREGRLERRRGVGPHGPRASFVVAPSAPRPDP